MGGWPFPREDGTCRHPVQGPGHYQTGTQQRGEGRGALPGPGAQEAAVACGPSGTHCAAMHQAGDERREPWGADVCVRRGAARHLRRPRAGIVVRGSSCTRSSWHGNSVMRPRAQQQAPLTAERLHGGEHNAWPGHAPFLGVCAAEHSGGRPGRAPRTRREGAGTGGSAREQPRPGAARQRAGAGTPRRLHRAHCP
jgi:hypothetical protein